jgi:hypothetical protein
MTGPADHGPAQKTQFICLVLKNPACLFIQGSKANPEQLIQLEARSIGPGFLLASTILEGSKPKEDMASAMLVPSSSLCRSSSSRVRPRAIERLARTPDLKRPPSSSVIAAVSPG